MSQNSASEWLEIGLDASTVDAKIRAFENVIQLDPNYLEAYYYLGLAYKSKGNFSEAEVALNKAYFKNPFALNKTIKTRILFELGDIYTNLGKMDKAKEALLGAKELTDNDLILGRIHYQLGQIHLKEGDVNQALIQLRTGKALLPQNAELFDEAIALAASKKSVSNKYMNGISALNSGRYREAISLFKEVINSDPNFKDVHQKRQEAERALQENAKRTRLNSLYSQASQKSRRQQVGEAMDLLNQVIEIDPNYKDAQSLLDRLKRSRNQKPEIPEIEQTYRQGRIAFNREEWSRALDAFQEVRSTDPDYKDVVNLIAETNRGLAQQNQLAGLEKLYQDGLSSMEKQGWNQARSTFEKVKAIDPNYDDVSTKIETIRNAKNNDSTHAREDIESLYQNGLFALQNGDWIQAVLEFEKVHMMDPHYKDLQNKLADARFNLKKHNTTMVETDESESDSLLILGTAVSLILIPLFGILMVSPATRARLYLLQGKHGKAAELYEKLLEKNRGKIKYYS
ncbi:tetratricopeptide repeat protein, partial [candidate division KSB1 bacterium]|nr:tetratricopeptide repeat protein [candidate division KSB1 bacterium]